MCSMFAFSVVCLFLSLSSFFFVFFFGGGGGRKGGLLVPLSFFLFLLGRGGGQTNVVVPDVFLGGFLEEYSPSK